ncbi:MAG: HNH endonuclease, partial [Planctomycetaceae bacterium]|nr:HNH endonuclease [Planctomycetaceae bacterium]
NTEQEYYFTFDGHGSTRVLTDLAGMIVQIYSFDAYGNALGFDPKDALTEFLYSGEQFDSKIGQIYLRARYYDPATGRFNRLDPFFGDVSDPKSLHKYTYTHGDPVNMTDPSGLFGVGGIGVSMSIGNAMSGMRAYAAYGVRKVACGAVSGALVGSIIGALMEACKQADMVVNGNNFDPTDTTLSILISAMEGAASGMADGAKDGFKEWASLGWSGKYDQIKAISEFDKTFSQMVTLFSEGKYFEASFVGISTLIDIGYGPKLNSLFCFIDDTVVMLDKGEITEEEATIAITQQIGLLKQEYGAVIAVMLCIAVTGLIIQSRRNKKQNFETKKTDSNNEMENTNNKFVSENTGNNSVAFYNNPAEKETHRNRLGQYLLTSSLILFVIGFALFFWNNFNNSNTINQTPFKPVAHSLSNDVRFAKIQDVQVGERAIGKNPEITDSDRTTFFPDPEPATWRKLTLEMIKSDGKRLDITLLRPLSWIGESQADIGTTIYLDLPEMGAQGFAKVLNIEPCPPIKRGNGNVITGTFHHEATNTIDLYVEGLSQPIGCTDNHPFWSVTQNEFVEVRKLLPGEELQLYNGQTAKVIQILPRPGPERVHNLEVMNEHVYRVAQNGILVHNTYSSVLTIRNKSLAGKNHPVTGVPFDSDGFPDFSAHVQKSIKLPTIKGYIDDFAEADKLAGITAEYRKANKLTWHHHQDCKTMQLIPSLIHQQTGHTGGLAIVNASQ